MITQYVRCLIGTSPRPVRSRYDDYYYRCQYVFHLSSGPCKRNSACCYYYRHYYYYYHIALRNVRGSCRIAFSQTTRSASTRAWLRGLPACLPARERNIRICVDRITDAFVCTSKADRRRRYVLASTNKPKNDRPISHGRRRVRPTRPLRQWYRVSTAAPRRLRHAHVSTRWHRPMIEFSPIGGGPSVGL